MRKNGTCRTYSSIKPIPLTTVSFHDAESSDTNQEITQSRTRIPRICKLVRGMLGLDVKKTIVT
jgi:hypothetical protein